MLPFIPPGQPMQPMQTMHPIHVPMPRPAGAAAGAAAAAASSVVGLQPPASSVAGLQPPAYYAQQLVQQTAGMSPYQAAAAFAAIQPSRPISPASSVRSAAAQPLTYERLMQHEAAAAAAAAAEPAAEAVEPIDEGRLQEEIAQLTRRYTTIAEQLDELNGRRKKIMEEKKQVEEKLNEDMTLVNVDEIQITNTRVLTSQEREPGLPSLNRKKLAMCLKAYFGNDLHAQHCMSFLETALAELDTRERKKKNVIRLIDIGRRKK